MNADAADEQERGWRSADANDPAEGAGSDLGAGDAAPSDLAHLDSTSSLDSLIQPADAVRDDLRRRLTDQFEAWLDRMLAGEPAPQGLPVELVESVLAAPRAEDEAADLYTLFAAMTTLSGEIRLQGRAFKQVADAVAPLAGVGDRLDELNAAQRETTEQLAQLEESLQAVDEEAAGTAEPAPDEVLGVLFDLYDRLNRGMKTFEAAMQGRAAPSWIERIASRRRIDSLTGTIESLRDSYRLTLARLDAALQRWGIERIGVQGRPFDPRQMTAIEIEQTTAVPDGTVIEVYRSGYALHGRMLATAQVKVARAPS